MTRRTPTDDRTDEPLDPAELELPGDAVRELDGDRYVVEAGADDANATAGSDGPPRSTGGAPAAPLDARSERYAFDLAAKTEGGVERTRVASNDVRETFDALLRWYAARVASDRSPERTLAALARESELLGAD